MVDALTATTASETEEVEDTKKTKFWVRKKGTSNWEYYKEMLPVLEAYGRKIKKNIYCVNPHQEPTLNFDDLKATAKADGRWIDGETIAFVFWSAPRVEEIHSRRQFRSETNNLFGKYEIYPVSAYMKSSQTGLDLSDDSGIVWGEQTSEEVVWFHFDLPHFENAKAILIDCIESLEKQTKDVDFASLADIAEKKRREIARAAYINACTQRFRMKEQSAKANFDSATVQLEEHRRYLAEKIEMLELRKQELEEAKLIVRRSKRGGMKFGNEFDALMANVKIEKVEVPEGRVDVYTTLLTSNLLPDGTTRVLGKFKITFFTDQPTEPQVKNLTNVHPTSGAQHPHIQGGICWGNYTENIAVLASTKEYAAAAATAIHYLENVNPHDGWGRSVYDWPIHTKSESIAPVESADAADEIDREMCEFCELEIDALTGGCRCCVDCQESGDTECTNYDECSEERGCYCMNN